MSEYASPEIDNYLQPQEAEMASAILRNVIQIVSAGPVRVSQADPKTHPHLVGLRYDAGDVTLWCASNSMMVEAGDAACCGLCEAFSIDESEAFSSNALPNDLDGALVRLQRWIDVVSTLTSPEIIEQHNREEQQAGEAAVAAATVEHPDWSMLLLDRDSPSTVQLRVIFEPGETDRAYMTSYAPPHAGDVTMSPQLAAVLNRFPNCVTVTSGCRRSRPGLNICLWPQMTYIIDKRLSAEEKQSAIALAQREKYRLLSSLPPMPQPQEEEIGG